MALISVVLPLSLGPIIDTTLILPFILPSTLKPVPAIRSSRLRIRISLTGPVGKSSSSYLIWESVVSAVFLTSLSNLLAILSRAFCLSLGTIDESSTDSSSDTSSSKESDSSEEPDLAEEPDLSEEPDLECADDDELLRLSGIAFS